MPSPNYHELIEKYQKDILIATSIKKMDLCDWFNINPYELRTKHREKICEKLELAKEDYKKITNSSFPVSSIQKLKEYIYEVAPHLKPKEEKTAAAKQWRY